MCNLVGIQPTRDRLRHSPAIPDGTETPNLLPALNHEYLRVYAGFSKTMHSIMHWVFALNRPPFLRLKTAHRALYAKIGLLAATSHLKGTRCLIFVIDLYATPARSWSPDEGRTPSPEPARFPTPDEAFTGPACPTADRVFHHPFFQPS